MQMKIALAGYAIVAAIGFLGGSPATAEGLPRNWDAPCNAAKLSADDYQACIKRQLDIYRERQSAAQPVAQDARHYPSAPPFPGLPQTTATCAVSLKPDASDAVSRAVLTEKHLTQKIGESDEAYIRRIRPLVKGLSPVHIEFSVPTAALSYDRARDAYSFAPEHVADWMMPIESLSLDQDRNWFASTIDTSHKPDRKHQAQNVFGAKFAVTEADSSWLSYVFAGAPKNARPLPAISFQNPHPGKDVSVFRVVIEGDVSAPYFFVDEDVAKPTFHNRYGYTHRFIGVPFVPRCGVVVDQIGGKTVALFDPSAL